MSCPPRYFFPSFRYPPWFPYRSFVVLCLIICNGKWEEMIPPSFCPPAHKKPSSIKKQKHHFAYKGPYSQSYGFPGSHTWMWKLDHKEGWALKNWCFQIVVLEKTLESPLDCKEIKPVHPKGNQPWLFIGRTDAVAPILWPPDAKSWLIQKDPDAGRDWRQKKSMAEDRCIDGSTNSMDMNLSKLWEIVKDRKAWRAAVHGLQRIRHDLPDWTTTNKQWFTQMKRK